MGVSILAVLHLVGGALMFGLQFWLLANLNSMDESLRALGIPPALLIVGVMFLAVVTIAAGIGMWVGTQWGWWLAAFNFVYNIFRNGSALVTILGMSDQWELGDRDPEYYVFKHGGRIVVQFLLLLYFLNRDVLRFFGLRELNRVKAVCIIVGVCVGILVTTSMVGLIFN